MNEWMNECYQSINESNHIKLNQTNRPINQSSNQSINQPNQQFNQPFNQWSKSNQTNPSTNQPT